MTPDELRAFRARHGLTRVQVAALIGVAPGTIRNWEQDACRISQPAAALIRRLDADMTAAQFVRAS